MHVAVVQSDSPDRSSLHRAGIEAARGALYSAGRTPSSYQPVCKDIRGKPYGVLEDGSLMPLSISHAFPFALAVTTSDAHVVLGADIERVREFRQETWEAFLTPEEQEYIAHFVPEEQHRARALCWSLKEAVLKALGCGLRMHPARIDTSEALSGSEDARIRIDGALLSAQVRWRHLGEHMITTIIALPKEQAYTGAIIPGNLYVER